MQSTLRTFLNIFPEKMKKRTVWYLFDRYLGHFLIEKLTLDQLSVDIIGGRGSINNIGLDVDSLNEELSFLPFKFIMGCFIDEISLYVPWSTLLTDSCNLQINGATLVCQLHDTEEGKNMVESDYLSRSFMSSSMQLASEICNESEDEKYEGLEIFAQLIDSVLRRIELIATNTTFVLRKKLPHSSSSMPPMDTKEEEKPHNSATKNEVNEIKMKVKYLKCEENSSPEDDESVKNDDVNLAPRLISKRLTVENVEIFIGSACICVLRGKHAMDIRVKDNKCDMQVFLSTILLAAIRSTHIDVFREIFGSPSDNDVSKNTKGEKTMSTSDYARIEEQLQTDFANMGQTDQACPINLATYGGNFSPNIYSFSDAKFLPLNVNAHPHGSTTFSNDVKDNARCFHCTIKVPGIAFCVLSSCVDENIDCNDLKFHANPSNVGIMNAQLNDVLLMQHIRVLAMPLQIDIDPSSTKIVAGDLMIGERNHRGFINLASTDVKESNQQKSINFQCDIDSKRVKIASKTTTFLTIDPTLLERFDTYYKPGESKTSNELKVIFECENVKADLLFPIADLREESRGLHTKLHPEKMMFNANALKFQTNLLAYEITMDRLSAALVDRKNITHDIGTICSSGSESVKINIKNGPSASITLDSDDIRSSHLHNTEMDESIYISSNDRPEILTPFQTKRKVIKSTKDDDEQVICPKDRHSSLKYLETCQSLTQLQIEVIAPLVDVTLGKDELNVLYNRFGNDLALWYPLMKSRLSANSLFLSSGSTILNPISNKSQYYTCKSGLAESIDSETSFHSAEGSSNERMRNTCTCIMHAERLRLQFGPDECHHLIDSDDVFVGIAIGLEEDTSNVISIHGNRVAWDYGETSMIGNNTFIESTSSLNLTFDISRKENQSKKIKFALQLSDALLFNTQFEIFKDFWNYIKVTNEDVLGYLPLKTLTELHINVINSAIVHDKSTCPRAALITLDGAYITAMVVENTSETLFRFIIEESALYFKKNNLSSDSIKNYVCIVDSGLIDLYLKLSDDGDINFKASNNIINIRACSDSLNMLSNLIQSMVSNGNYPVDDEPPPYSPPQDESPRADVDDDDGEDSELPREATDQEVQDTLCANNFGLMNPRGEDNPSSSPMDESDFWILGDDDVGAGIKVTAEPTIRVLANEPIKVIDNYFGVTKSRPIPELIELIVERYLLEEMTLVINFFGGKDFEDDPDDEEDKDKFKPSDPFRRGSEAKVHFVDNSIHLWESLDLKSAPNYFNNDAHSSNLTSNLKIMGGRFRQNDVCVQLSLSKIKAVFDKFKETCTTSWRFIFMVNEIEIRDRVSKSNINKMLYEYTSENMPRRSSANMIYIRANTYRNSTDNHEECDLKVSVKPLRVNIDQDTIMFLMEYFHQVRCMNSTEDPCPGVPNVEAHEGQDLETSSNSECVPEPSCSPNLNLTLDDQPPSMTNQSSSKPSSLFIKSFLFTPDVPIRLDYHGKRVDFEQGALPGLLMGLAHLNQSELHLKKLHQKHGILGIDRVLIYALTEWFEDIKRHQLPSILGSIGPMNSVRQLIQGLIDLVWIPVDQYRRDRRLVRGLQRGASSFSSFTAMAVIDLANRLVHVIQGTAQFAHDVVSSSGSPQPPNHRGSIPTCQPRDLREGVATAYTVMREGLNQTYRNVATAGIQAEGYGEAVGGLIRRIPSNIFQPIIKVSEATSNVLVGMRNQLTPEARKEDQDKWKS